MGRDPTGNARAFVFGYGSLLELPAGTPCRLQGHRRRFGVAMDNRRTLPGYKYFLHADSGERPGVFVSFLDVVEAPGAAVDGLAVPVDAARLAELDDRERNYRRVEVGSALDVDLGGPVWVYAGVESARSRYARGEADGTAVVARGYVDAVRERFAAHGLAFDTEPEIPVMDLTRVEVPANGNGSG